MVSDFAKFALAAINTDQIQFAASDEEELREFATRILCAPLPAPVFEQPEIKIRRWEPLNPIDVTLPPPRHWASDIFFKRHPYLDLPCFEHVESRVLGRSLRSFTRGRPARFPSHKMRMTLRPEADNELRIARQNEVDPACSYFIDHPFEMKYKFATGRRRRHKPDELAVVSGITWVREIKYEKDASEPDNEARWPFIAATLNEIGLGYEVITERHLMHEPLYSNVNKLLESRNRLPPDETTHEILQWLMARDDRTPKSIEMAIANFAGLDERGIHCLIVKGYLSVDIHTEINLRSTVSPGRHALALIDSWSGSKLFHPNTTSRYWDLV